MAMPTSAWRSAGARSRRRRSPPPRGLLACRAATMRQLLVGAMRAKMTSGESSASCSWVVRHALQPVAGDHRGTRRCDQPDLPGDRQRRSRGWSPVIMITLMPASRHLRDRRRTSGRGGSSSPTRPAASDPASRRVAVVRLGAADGRPGPGRAGPACHGFLRLAAIVLRHLGRERLPRRRPARQHSGSSGSSAPWCTASSPAAVRWSVDSRLRSESNGTSSTRG